MFALDQVAACLCPCPDHILFKGMQVENITCSKENDEAILGAPEKRQWQSQMARAKLNEAPAGAGVASQTGLDSWPRIAALWRIVRK